MAAEGFAELVDACALLREGGREFRCVIAGRGPLRSSLRERITRAGLEDRVDLAGATRAEVRALLGDAAAFAAPWVARLPGACDPLPLTVLEAMSVGAPCVTTAGVRVPEPVVEGVTGLAVLPRDPIGLAEALEELLCSPRLRVHLARAARDRLGALVAEHPAGGARPIVVKDHPAGTTPRAAGWLDARGGHRGIAVAPSFPPPVS